MVIDPAISFGIGEARVNDAEQGPIDAARRIRNALNCCVRYVHHSGKANAREKAADQYAGRGGSAMADGARMVAVLQPLSPDEWLKARASPLMDGESGMVLALPKLSYCPPQPDTLIRRKGYLFSTPTAPKSTRRPSFTLTPHRSCGRCATTSIRVSSTPRLALKLCGSCRAPTFATRSIRLWPAARWWPSSPHARADRSTSCNPKPAPDNHGEPFPT